MLKQSKIFNSKKQPTMDFLESICNISTFLRKRCSPQLKYSSGGVNFRHVFTIVFSGLQRC